MHASYTPAFKACIQEGKAESVMCSYNAVNGKPACASPELLQGTLRGALGFEGVIVSDCGAVDGVFNLHEYTKCVVSSNRCQSFVAQRKSSVFCCIEPPCYRAKMP